MATVSKNNRPFDDFRLPITDQDYFFGHQELIESVVSSPFQVKILLGGRRMGKSSILNAFRWYLLNADQNSSVRALPVLFNLDEKQPQSLDNFRYLLIEQLKDTINNPQQELKFSTKIQQRWKRLITQIPEGGVQAFGINLKINNPDIQCCLKDSEFSQDLLNLIGKLQEKSSCNGVIFLLDGADFLIKQDWANDACSYLRSLKETKQEIKNSLGIVLTGFRDIKDYKQQKGSPLAGISKNLWINSLNFEETKKLIISRYEDEGFKIFQRRIESIFYCSGGHLYLTQQMINAMIDNQYSNRPRSGKGLLYYMISDLFDDYFGKCWDAQTSSYGFDETEQTIYKALIQERQGSAELLAKKTNLSRRATRDALKIITATGLIREVNEIEYTIGSQLFEKWVIDKIN